MSDLDTRFEKAAAEVHELDTRPDNRTLLKLYALYKQGLKGDVAGEKPAFHDFIGVAKYEAWEKLQGMDPGEARQRYVKLVESLLR